MNLKDCWCLTGRSECRRRVVEPLAERRCDVPQSDTVPASATAHDSSAAAFLHRQTKPTGNWIIVVLQCLPWTQDSDGTDQQCHHRSQTSNKMAFQLNADHPRLYLTLMRVSISPWPWTCDLDTRPWPRQKKRYLCIKNKVSRSRLSKFNSRNRQTHIHTQLKLLPRQTHGH